MKTINVRHNQTLLDVALQHCASAEAVFDICLANHLSLTSPLTPHTGTLKITANRKEHKEILQYYTSKNIVPATATENEPINQFAFPILGLPIIL